MKQCVSLPLLSFLGFKLRGTQDAQTSETAIVDPYTPSKLEDAAQKENVKIGEFLLTTHGHHDHAGCVEFFFFGNHSAFEEKN